jgi:hypothetical protein
MNAPTPPNIGVDLGDPAGDTMTIMVIGNPSSTPGRFAELLHNMRLRSGERILIQNMTLAEMQLEQQAKAVLQQRASDLTSKLLKESMPLIKMPHFSRRLPLPGLGPKPPARRSAAARKRRRIVQARMVGRPKKIRFRRYTHRDHLLDAITYGFSAVRVMPPESVVKMSTIG